MRSEKISSDVTKNSRRAGQYELRTGGKYAMMQKKKSLVSVLDFQETAEKDSVQTIVAETETTKIIWDSFRMSFQNI